MKKLLWDKKFSVSVHEIDEQHQRLFEMINDLSEAIAKPHEGETVDTVLLKMMDYLSYHFKAEEELMKQFNYPGYETQRAQHKDFVLQTINFEKRLQAGDEQLSHDVLNYLKEWLVKHIVVSDSKLGSFLVEQGQT